MYNNLDFSRDSMGVNYDTRTAKEVQEQLENEKWLEENQSKISILEVLLAKLGNNFSESCSISGMAEINVKKNKLMPQYENVPRYQILLDAICYYHSLSFSNDDVLVNHDCTKCYNKKKCTHQAKNSLPISLKEITGD